MSEEQKQRFKMLSNPAFQELWNTYLAEREMNDYLLATLQSVQATLRKTNSVSIAVTGIIHRPERAETSEIRAIWSQLEEAISRAGGNTDERIAEKNEPTASYAKRLVSKFYQQHIPPEHDEFDYFVRVVEQAMQTQRGATLEALNNYAVKATGNVMPPEMQWLVLYTTVDAEVYL